MTEPHTMPRTTKKTIAPIEKHTIPTVPEAEWPYQVPENWRWGYAPYVFNIEYGNGLATKDLTETGYPVFGANGQIGFYKEFMYKDSQALMSCRGAYSGTMNISLPNSYVTSNSLIISGKEHKYSPKFICYLFESQDVQKLISGTAQPQITIQAFQTYPIPLPPLAEQQRIVDRIERLFAKLDEAREKAQAVVDGFENRKAAILHKAFTGELTRKWREENNSDSRQFLEQIQLTLTNQKKHKLVQNDFLDNHKNVIPSKWVYTNLHNIAKLITDGEHKTPKRVDIYCGYYLLSARNVINDGVRLDDVDYVDENEFNIISRRCNPKFGDILISCSGSVGRCCVIQDNNKYCMVRSAGMISQEYCNARFIMYMIQSNEVQEQIQQLSKQTAQANLFLGAIASLYIPLPTREEQDLIVNIVDSLFTQERRARELAESVIAQIDGMKKAILARAFRGELGTNVPGEAACECISNNNH